MNLPEYQRAAFGTSKIEWKTARGRQVAILGVLGELGSLATVMKKGIRDGSSYSTARDDVLEECGDVLWYLAAIATHYELDLDQVTKDQAHAKLVIGENAHLWSLIDAVMLLNSILAADDENFAVQKEDLAEPLGQTAQMVLRAIEREGLNLSEVLQANLAKTRDLFDPVSGAAPNFDIECPIFESLPRKIEISFVERLRGTQPEVLMRTGGLTIGDRLTDNSIDADGYRFHDALHFGYVAVLGWSPVMRALFRLKRKSKPALDEQQDGARAIIIEEAITQQIFNHARDHELFENIERLDYGLLKWIKRMVRGLEVERASASEWQRAILEGYQAFRLLKANRGGILTIDCESRRLNYAHVA